MTTAQEVNDPGEVEHAKLISLRIDQGRLIHKEFMRIVEDRPARGSDLHGDDLATAWMQTSHVSVTALTMVADNMRAVCDMLRPADHLIVPMYAHYPVLRSVVEAAAEAKWLLTPDVRKERVARTLRAKFSDAKHDAELAKEQRETVAAMDDGGTHAEALIEADKHAAARYARDVAKIRSIAEEQQIPWAAVKSGLPPWIQIIKAVCGIEAHDEGVRVPGGYAAGLWKIMSGLSHPSTSRSVNHSAMERIDEATDSGVVTARLSASLRWTSEAMTVAWSTTHDALDLMERRQTVRLVIP